MIILSQKIKAFTLAEVLITLLIIGIVASIVIPNLIEDTRNAELLTAAKKAISSADQAIKLASVDNSGGFGTYNIFDPNAYTKFNAMKSKLNVIRECPFGSGSLGKCWAQNGVGKNIAGSNCVRWFVSNQNANYSIVTADGMYWMFYTYTSSAGQAWVAVDVNGSKGPNDWGKDVFCFNIDNARLTPFTYHCESDLQHNDGTPVYSVTEFKVPFLQ